MNLEKLRAAEASFLQRYPGGFDDPALEPVRKKHPMDSLHRLARDNLGKAGFNRPQRVVETLVKIIGRSSMVSRFEKAPFRDCVASLNSHEKDALVQAVYLRLHGRKQQGFELLVGMLQPYRLAKWPIVSAVPFYYAPTREVFVKPTTAKGIVAYLEVPDMPYRPTPDWAFYRAYQDLVARVKSEVHPSLSSNNAAITGFLMSASE